MQRSATQPSEPPPQDSGLMGVVGMVAVVGMAVGAEEARRVAPADRRECGCSVAQNYAEAFCS